MPRHSREGIGDEIGEAALRLVGLIGDVFEVVPLVIGMMACSIVGSDCPTASTNTSQLAGEIGGGGGLCEGMRGGCGMVTRQPVVSGGHHLAKGARDEPEDDLWRGGEAGRGAGEQGSRGAGERISQKSWSMYSRQSTASSTVMGGMGNRFFRTRDQSRGGAGRGAGVGCWGGAAVAVGACGAGVGIEWAWGGDGVGVELGVG